MRRHLQLLAVLLATATALLPHLAAAQQTESRIVGTIADQSGAVLPGVTVTVKSKATGTVRTVLTDAEGRNVVTNLGTRRVGYRCGAQWLRRRREGDTAWRRRHQDHRRDDVGGHREQSGSPSHSTRRSLTRRRPRPASTFRPKRLPIFQSTGATSPIWSDAGHRSDNRRQRRLVQRAVQREVEPAELPRLQLFGVDGTYVWDASPGYLNATGSQFRLQTSMESVAEFRVNSGLAPAKSGLGAGGNTTVVSKSGSNQHTVRSSTQRATTPSTRRANTTTRKQTLETNQFGGSIGGPIRTNRTFFFASYEGLKQTTGLSFTEAVPSDEAIRRIQAGRLHQMPGRDRVGPTDPGGRATACRVSPRDGVHRRPAPRAGHAQHRGGADRAHFRDPRRSPVQQHPVFLHAPDVQRRRSRHT